MRKTALEWLISKKTDKKFVMPNCEATKWLRKFYKALKDPGLKIRIKKDMVDDRGYAHEVTRTRFGIKGLITGINRGGDSIDLNPSRQRFGGMIKVLIHELIHQVDSTLTEDQVDWLEHEVYNALTNRQLYNLMKRTFK